MILKNNAEIVERLSRYYRKELFELKEYFETNEYYKHSEIVACEMEDMSIQQLFKLSEDEYGDYNGRKDLFYERQSGLVMTGVKWHYDFASALYSDIYTDLFEKEILSGYYLAIDVPDYAMDRGWYGFISTCGTPFLRYEFSMNTQEKMYFKDYIKQGY